MRSIVGSLMAVGSIVIATLVPGPVAAAHHRPLAGPTTWTYPGSCGAVTLQQCVDNASPGDTIKLTFDDTRSDFISISKTITIGVASGHTPTILGVNVYDGGSATPLAVTLKGFGVTEYIESSFTGGTGHSLAISHVAVRQGEADASSGPGISLDAGAPSSYSVVASHVAFSNEWGGIVLDARTNGSVSFKAIGDSFTAHGATYAGSAIELDSTGSATLHADILNDAIWDVANCNCGGASGIFLYPQDTSHMHVNVVGDTFEAVKSSGLAVRNALAAGGGASLDVFDDVFAHATRSAIGLDDSESVPGRLTLRAGYIDFYKNAFPSFVGNRSLGSHDVGLNPGFQDRTSGDLRLAATSPIIDRGEVCSPGGVANLDAAGHGRLAGASVDLGAYERGAGVPTGVARVGGSGADTMSGTPGADILCGMGGNDVLFGTGGKDFIDGGTGRDVLDGGTGADRLFGRSGDDTLCARDGTSGNDRLDGGPGTDGYRADSGDQRTSVEHTASC